MASQRTLESCENAAPAKSARRTGTKMTTHSSKQLVLPKIVKKPTGKRLPATPARGSMEPATTAASVRREAQRGLMEEWGSGSHPSTHGGSCSSVSSSRTSGAGSAKCRLTTGTTTRLTPTAPPSGLRTAGPGDTCTPRSVARRRAGPSIDPSLVPCPDPARQAAGRQSLSKHSSIQPGRSDLCAVGVINGVPFQTVSGDFGGLVDQWLTTSSKVLSPKSRRSASARAEPRQDSTKQKATVEKARVKMRRAADKTRGTSHNKPSKSTKQSSVGRGMEDRRMQSQAKAT